MSLGGSMEELFGGLEKTEEVDECIALITVKYFYEFGTYLLNIKDLEIRQGVLNSVVEQFFDSLFSKEQINIPLYFYLGKYHYRYYKKTNRDLKLNLDKLTNMVYNFESIESKFLMKDVKAILAHLFPSSKGLIAKFDLVRWPVMASIDISNDLGEECFSREIREIDPLIEKFLDDLKNTGTQDKKILGLGEATRNLIQSNKELESFILTLGPENNIIN